MAILLIEMATFFIPVILLGFYYLFRSPVLLGKSLQISICK